MTKNRNRRRRRLAVIIAAAAALAFAAFAYTAGNIVPPTKAGDGANTISGYTVTNVKYVLATNPQNIDKVNFTLNATAGTVKARVVSTGSWADCGNGGTGNNWSCDFSTDPAVFDADQLTVVATE